MTFGTGTFGTVPYGGSSTSTGTGLPPGGGFSTSPGSSSLQEVTLYVEIDFSQAVEGIGVGATSPVVLWDLGEWDASYWEEGTVWTDVTGWTLGVDTSASFSKELTAYTAGRLTVTLDNADGRFSPDNTDSPYRVGDSTTIGVLRPIRVWATYGPTEFDLFTGRIEEWSEDPDGIEGGTVTVTAADPFAELAAFDSYAQTPAGAGDTFGERIERILTNAGWTGERRIDAGVHTMQATTLAQNAVSELKLTADSEGGAVWVGPDGVFYADGQDALLAKARSSEVQVFFANTDDATSSHFATPVGYEQGSVSLPYDGSQVVNLAAYARAGGTVQVAESQPSRVLYGDRQDQRSDLICEDDDQVTALAERKVALYQNPERRVEQLTFSPMLQPTEDQLIAAWEAIAYGRIALRSLVQLDHTTPSGFHVTKYLYIRGISHRITGTTWTTNLSFTSASVMYSLVGSDWDLGLWDTAGWAF